MAADPNCVRHFSASNRIVRFEIPFNFHSCGIKSRRMTHPRPGLEYSLTTIISKGHAHMTEDDRMFALSCRYYSNHRDVGTVMEVSTYSKSYLVFHEWRCADSSFALKVYECYVHDGHNRKYRLVDERGCSIDKTIVPEDNVYDPSLNFAFAPSRVFKFAESHRMFFNCLLMMCPKSDPSCRMAVPPNCSKRERRAAANGTNTRTLDAIYSVNATLPFELSGESTRSLERSREQADELLAQAEAEVAAERAEKKAAEEKGANSKHEKAKPEAIGRRRASSKHADPLGAVD
ncbi:ZP domain-containing protein [Aphelenchoides fujianensis]|nr:ZP domain-containing protein [Aphelenchoides fujianensis]